MAKPQTIFITGVGKGIGKALTEIYLSRPDHLVIGSLRDTSSPAADALKALPVAHGTRLLLVNLESKSTTDPAQALAAIQREGITHLDVVLANAGGYPEPGPLESVGRKELVSCFEVNAAAPLLLFQTLRPLLKEAAAPKLAVVSTSAASIASMPQLGSHILPAYGASKAALNWLTQALHCTQDWLTVITLHPGLVQTAQGNWVANKVGLGEAPTTIEASASSIVQVVDNASRDKTSGKFISSLEGTEVPW